MSLTTLHALAECGFVGHGERYGLRANDSQLLDRLVARVPLGWQSSVDGNQSDISTWYTLLFDAGTSLYRLTVDDEVLIESIGLGVVLDAFESHAELTTAEHARHSLFVHAGVVAWRHQAIVMPGASGSGKTTLVRAFLDAGATYLSDDYAPLDRNGFVHPYPRPLSMRQPDRNRKIVTAESLDAHTSPVALPVRVILLTSYETDAVWEPLRISGAKALVALMQHSVAARRDPAFSMPILKAAVSRALALEGGRGEADIVVRHMLSASTIF